MLVGRRGLDHERYAFRVGQQAVLTARAAAIRRIRPGFGPPSGAFTKLQSTRTLDQSSRSATIRASVATGPTATTPGSAAGTSCKNSRRLRWASLSNRCPSSTQTELPSAPGALPWVGNRLRAMARTGETMARSRSIVHPTIACLPWHESSVLAPNGQTQKGIMLLQFQLSNQYRFCP